MTEAERPARRFCISLTDPDGVPENPEHCIMSAWSGSGPPSQCDQPRGHGPGSLWCAGHEFFALEKYRENESQARESGDENVIYVFWRHHASVMTEGDVLLVHCDCVQEGVLLSVAEVVRVDDAEIETRCIYEGCRYVWDNPVAFSQAV